MSNVAANSCSVESGATGRNLLYFGCRRRDQDFLYRYQLGIFQCLVGSLLSWNSMFLRMCSCVLYF